MDALLLKINQYVINPIIGFMFVLAFVYLLWGIVEYFLYQDSEDDRTQGKRHILWGLVGILIMTGFWGIIQIIAGTFGVSVAKP